nr:hypothetical protein Itr_chr08CG11820 [Ipomoea trifida]
MLFLLIMRFFNSDSILSSASRATLPISDSKALFVILLMLLLLLPESSKKACKFRILSHKDWIITISRYPLKK